MFLEVYPQVLGVSIHKACKTCGGVFPATTEYFNRRSVSPDGLAPDCRACATEHQKKYRASNRDRIRQRDREYQRKYRAEHADEVKAAQAEYFKCYYAMHAERLKQYQREYRVNNPDRVKRDPAYWRGYFERNPGKMRQFNATRRARKANAPGKYSASELGAIRIAQTDKQGRLICWRCGKPINGVPHLDHWIPLDMGGRNDAGNLHYMHARCNTSKGAKHPTEIGRLI